MKATKSSIALSLSLVAAVYAQDGLFTPSTTIGGYGELHYNQSIPKFGKAYPGELDFHRFVLFFGHSFSDKWSFKGELELEHNVVEVGGSTDDKGKFSTNRSGYLPLEQATVQYRHSEYFQAGAGVILAPAGLINNDHEPARFLTVERPLYHSKIIPSTWFGNGLEFKGSLLSEQIHWQAVVMEGLNTTKITAKDALRPARQKGLYSSTASVLSGFRLDYDVVEGATVGASIHHDQLLAQPKTEDRVYDGVTLTEFHGKYENYGVFARAEYGMISYESTFEKKGLLEASSGWYAELGYNVFKPLDCKSALIPYFHYSSLNTSEEVTGGGSVEKDNKVDLWKVGFSFKPVNSVALKLDYGRSTTGTSSKSDVEEINAGVGYQF